jgi:LPXTG-site transpeptidase (sortase) family protein
MCHYIDTHLEPVMTISSWEQFLDAVWLRKVSFLVTFFFVYMLSFAFLSWLDVIPEPKTSIPKDVVETPVETTEVTDTDLVVVEEAAHEPSEAVIDSPVYPDTIIIDSLDRTVSVLNPTSREVADLDAALLYGIVRHPDSATLEQPGTVFLLGHSSYLPNVMNKNFQAFNGIQTLKFGDTIRVQAGEQEYTYRVDRVYRAKADEVTVPIAGDVKRLVLATCNSFGKIDDRYIVEADLVEVQKLAVAL